MAPKPDDQEKVEIRLSQLLEEIEDLSEDIKHTYGIGQSVSEDPSKYKLFKARLSRLDSAFDKFTTHIADAKRCARAPERKGTLENLVAINREIRDIYYNTLALDISGTSSNETSMNITKLPTINLPKYNGQLSTWATFRDTYESLIHTNSSLSAIQKFLYLKTSLEGVALQTVSSIEVTSDNYEAAWEAVKDRFDNKRIQATHYLSKVFNFKPLLKANYSSLENFSNVVLESASAFQRLKIEDEGGFILLNLALRLLDAKTRDKFETELKNKCDIPKFTDFVQFIHGLCNTLQTESLNTPICSTSLNRSYKPTGQYSGKIMSATCENNNNINNYCSLCKEKHRLYRCPKFLSMNASERYQLVKQKRLCVNCLSLKHANSKCPSSSLCAHCQKGHHTLLHFNTKNKASPRHSQSPVAHSNPTNVAETSSHYSSPACTQKNVQGTSTSILSSTVQEHTTSVLLGTSLAQILDSAGHLRTIRLVLDCGAQRSCITFACAKRLGLPLRQNNQTLCGVGDTPIKGSTYQTTCKLVPCGCSGPQITTSAVIIPQITSELPNCTVPKGIMNYFQHCKLGDPDFEKSRPVDFLVGADLFGEVLLTGKINTPEGFPNGIKTVFGWVIMGPCTPSSQISNKSLVMLETSSETNKLETLIQNFWEIEEVPRKIAPSNDDINCERHFTETHSRDSNGRYIVRLPFKNPITSPPENLRCLTLKRFQNLEIKLNKHPVFKQKYSDVVREYIKMGYMTCSSSEGSWYLPHHAVLKDSESTSLRIVFDASMPTCNGSLNDHLLIGPKLQLDIRDVILNFRKFVFALTADIRKMFLQVLVHPEDRKFQHILFRFDPSEPIKEYEMSRVTFGLSCSPFLAIRVLRQLVADEGHFMPLASRALTSHTYVDDILTGSDTLEGIHLLRDELITLLKKGGFELQKWSSNCEALPNTTPNNLDSPYTFSSLENTTVKVLGLQWNSSSDTLSYHIQVPKLIFSKRAILSTIARLYDPLGYLAPVIFKSKLILQQTWLLKLTWDESLPIAIAKPWEEFCSELASLTSISIPRCLFPTKALEISVVGFADASSSGYAAVIYLRIMKEDCSIQTHLLFAKTRLAPLKTISVPRLELCASLLLTRTLKSMNPFFEDLNIQSRYLFTDSSVVMGWLQSSPSRFKVFVANRITEILEESSFSEWYHVPSHDNAADVASRGTNPSSLEGHKMWWHGPSWLQTHPSKWATSKNIHTSDLPEVKPDKILLAEKAALPYLINWMQRFSSFTKFQRSLAFILRFRHNCLAKPGERITGGLRVTELNTAIQLIIKQIQEYYLASEYAQLKQNTLPDKLKNLSPFIDSLGLLRVGGRLKYSPLNYDNRHPLILPTKCHFTNILVDYYHKIYLHAGPRLLQSLLQRHYWIISARRIIRSRIHQCQTCHKLSAKPSTPFMGDLPPNRFAQGRPFVNVGIDFAGPFWTKDRMGRKYKLLKTYLSLFVCLSTKAVHLELVSDLSTDSFLACLDRFVARRGLPSKIITDHGRNFVGADKRLRDLFSWFQEETVNDIIHDHLSSKSVKWEFIPPSAPHFGGIWEAGVKSFKTHLVRVLGNQHFTFEELYTLTVRIEAVLNSRPLCPLSSSPEETDALTPGHFLIGGPLVSFPEHNLAEEPMNRLSRWQLLQKCIQHIWKRWRFDYLNSLQQRVKWQRQSPNVTPNTLVLLRTPNSTPMTWPMGRITEVLPGKDGIVRVVRIKTSTGEYMRPVTQIVPLLPFCNNE